MKLSELPEKVTTMDIKDIITAKRSYRYGEYAQVNKVFNHGMGSLALFQFDGCEKSVYVNTILANKSDWEVLKKSAPDYKPIAVSLGYPDWYFIRELHNAKKVVGFNYKKYGYDMEKGEWL